MTTTTVPIRYFYGDDGEVCEPSSWQLGDMVQIGDAEPKPTSQLTGDERDLVLADFARSHRQSEWDFADYVHQLALEWTDEQIAERLHMEPGDVSLFRATAWFLTIGDAAIIAECLESTVPDLYRRAQEVAK